MGILSFIVTSRDMHSLFLGLIVCGADVTAMSHGIFLLS